jgi:hypothetical protein
VPVMNDSSSALGQPAIPSRLQTFTTGQLTRDRRANEILHADVVLSGPYAKALDQRAWQLRGQRVDWFVSLDTRARHNARIRPSAEASSNGMARVGIGVPAYLYACSWTTGPAAMVL